MNRRLLVNIGCSLPLGPLFLYYVALVVAWSKVHFNDFGKFYYGLQAWHAGYSLYTPTPATHLFVGKAQWHEFLNMNPPHLHILLEPLMWMPLSVAAVTWTVLNIVAGLFAARLTFRELGLTVPDWLVIPTVMVVVASASTQAVILTGQFVGFLLLPMTLAWLSARRGRWPIAGAWLGILISIKPFLGLFLPYLILTRRWRAAAALVMSAGACFLIGLAIFGVDEHRAWIGALGAVDWSWAAMNGSLHGMLTRTLNNTPYFTPLLLRPTWIRPLWLATSVVVGVLSFATARRSVDHAFSVLTLGALLISPLGWVYYLWLALPGWLAVRQRCRSGVSLWLGLACLSAPLGVLAWLHPVASVTIGSAYTWGMLALWSGLVLDSEARSTPEVHVGLPVPA